MPRQAFYQPLVLNQRLPQSRVSTRALNARLQPFVDVILIGDGIDAIVSQLVRQVTEAVATGGITVQREVDDADVVKSLIADGVVVSLQLAFLILGIDLILDDDRLLVIGHQYVDVAVLASHRDVLQLKPSDADLMQEGFEQVAILAMIAMRVQQLGQEPRMEMHFIILLSQDGEDVEAILRFLDNLAILPGNQFYSLEQPFDLVNVLA